MRSDNPDIRHVMALVLHRLDDNREPFVFNKEKLVRGLEAIRDLEEQARLGAAVEAMPRNRVLIHSAELRICTGEPEWQVYKDIESEGDAVLGGGKSPQEALDSAKG